MIADKIKELREHKGITQSELAKLLGITRSSVNAWEMGISVPSTQYVVELANIFKVSTDYLLGVQSTVSISVAGLTEKDILVVHQLIRHLQDKNSGRYDQ
ncbi:MAG: helix-turn-helix domain-containing protein [Eubacteriales bacterium]